MRYLRKLLRLLVAFFRLNQKIVCEESTGRGLHNDFHDYPDDVEGFPWHFFELECKHCGKHFTI